MFFFELLIFLALLGTFVEFLIEMPRKPEWMKILGALLVILITMTSLLMLKFISDHLFYSPGRIIPRIYYPRDAYTADTYEAGDFVFGNDAPEIEKRTRKRLHGDYVDRLIDDLNSGEGNVPLRAASKLADYSSEPRVMQALLLKSHCTYTAYRDSAKSILYGKNDPITVLNRIKPAVLEGTDAEVLYNLGKTYYDKGDAATGIPLIRQAVDLARSQNPHTRLEDWAREGNSLIAHLYANGVSGVPRNSEEALKFFIRYAEEDYRVGAFELGIIYAEGKYGIKPNKEEAALWLERAASTYNNEPASDRLAEFLYEQKKYKRALPWMEKRVQKGDKEYQYRLALMYMNANGVERDYAKAEELLRKAISHEKSPEQLLKIYKSGHGSEKDTARVIRETWNISLK